MSTKSFTTQAATIGGPIDFDVDGEVFWAAAAMPAEALLLMAVIADADEEAPSDEAARAVLNFLDMVLLDDDATEADGETPAQASSAERYAARMKSPRNPIRLEEASEHAKWLISEKYQSRPTVPPSS